MPCLPSGAAVLRLTEMAIEQAGLADLLQRVRREAVEISKLSRGAWSECSLMYLMLMAFIKTQSAGKAECLSVFKARKQLQMASSPSQNDCFSGPDSALGSADASR